MAINKVIYGTSTLIDLTADTVAPDTLRKDISAHDKSGTEIIGTLESGGSSSGDCNIKIIDVDAASQTYYGTKNFTLQHNLGRKPKLISYPLGGNLSRITYGITNFTIFENDGYTQMVFFSSESSGEFSWDNRGANGLIPSNGFIGRSYYIQVGNANESTIELKFGETSEMKFYGLSGFFLVI